MVGDLARWLRDEGASGSARVARCSAIPACPLRCRIKPYLIKAAPHGAAARRQRRAQPPKAPRGARRATPRDSPDQHSSFVTPTGWVLLAVPASGRSQLSGARLSVGDLPLSSSRHRRSQGDVQLREGSGKVGSIDANH